MTKLFVDGSCGPCDPSAVSDKTNNTMETSPNEKKVEEILQAAVLRYNVSPGMVGSFKLNYLIALVGVFADRYPEVEQHLDKKHAYAKAN